MFAQSDLNGMKRSAREVLLRENLLGRKLSDVDLLRAGYIVMRCVGSDCELERAWYDRGLKVAVSLNHQGECYRLEFSWDIHWE